MPDKPKLLYPALGVIAAAALVLLAVRLGWMTGQVWEALRWVLFVAVAFGFFLWTAYR